MEKLIIVGSFDENTQSKFKEVIKDITRLIPNTKASSLGMHISITPPITGVSENLLVKTTERIKKTMGENLMVSLPGIDYFWTQKTNQMVIYFAVNAPFDFFYQLYTLRNEAKDLGGEWPSDEYPFHLHATICTIKDVLTRTKAECLLDRVRKMIRTQQLYNAEMTIKVMKRHEKEKRWVAPRKVYYPHS